MPYNSYFSFQLYIATIGHVNKCSSISASGLFLLPGKLYAVKMLIASSNWKYTAGYTLKYKYYIYLFYDAKNHDTIIKIETKYSSG